jgi:hypothetical protein
MRFFDFRAILNLRALPAIRGAAGPLAWGGTRDSWDFGANRDGLSRRGRPEITAPRLMS